MRRYGIYDPKLEDPKDKVHLTKTIKEMSDTNKNLHTKLANLTQKYNNLSEKYEKLKSQLDGELKNKNHYVAACNNYKNTANELKLKVQDKTFQMERLHRTNEKIGGSVAEIELLLKDIKKWL